LKTRNIYADMRITPEMARARQRVMSPNVGS